MDEWVSSRLSDVVELRRGFDLPNTDRTPGPYPVLSAGKAVGSHNEGPVRGPGFVVGRATNLGIPTWSDTDFWPLNTTLYVADFKGHNPKFLYHLFEILDLAGYDSGSVQPMLNRNYISSVPVKIPPRVTQDAISRVVGALDDKIAANDQVLLRSSQLQEVVFERAILDDSQEVTVDEVADFHNRRRVPLSSRERDSRRGTTPYYGAAGQLDSVDEALFDGEFVLVGEDGTVVRNEGLPVVQYIWGPSWVNNHAHVLTGRVVSTELLKLAIQRESVAHIVTGAVQPKISMGNLKSLIVSVPVSSAEIEGLVQSLAANSRALADAKKVLVSTRDELLPLLMSGKVRVKDAEKVVEEVV